MTSSRSPEGPGPGFTTTSQPIYLLPRWQKVLQYRATQRICTDVPDWVATSAVQQPTFSDSDSFNFKCHGRQLAPNRCNLGGGRSVWDVVEQPSPGLLYPARMRAQARVCLNRGQRGLGMARDVLLEQLLQLAGKGTSS